VSALATTPRGLEREREAEYGGGTSRLGGTTGDARTERAAADDERKVDQLTATQILDHSEPCSIELRSARWRPPPGDPVGLLDECHAKTFF
jgi:hypothetical protein